MSGYDTKIFSIVNEYHRCVFIGSTTGELEDQFRYLSRKSSRSMTRIPFYIIKCGKYGWKTELLEIAKVNSNRDLLLKKTKWIDYFSDKEYEIINKIRYRTDEYKKERERKYKYENRHKTQQRRVEKLSYYYTCDCGARYKKICESMHVKTKKHIEFKKNPLSFIDDDIFTKNRFVNLPDRLSLIEEEK